MINAFSLGKSLRFPAYRTLHLLLWVFFLAGILISCWRMTYQINPDNIGYMRAAHYYSVGQWDLAINGYWGPLASWLMVPFYRAGISLVISQQIVTFIGSVFFYGSAQGLMRRLGLSKGQLLAASVPLVLLIIGVTIARGPDLLLAGWLSLGAALMLSPRYGRHQGVALSAGLCWGAAYLSKALGLPGGLAGILLIHLLRRYANEGKADSRIRWSSLAMVYIAFFAVSSVWIVALSKKYDRFTFSTSGRIAHAISHPDVREHEPFFFSFHEPEKGRVTQWEDPSILPYRYWSPLDSPREMRAQLKVIYDNTRHVLNNIVSLDLFGLALSSLLGVWLISWPWTKASFLAHRWQWGGLMCAIYMGPYLLTYAGPLRYLLPCVPYLLAGTFGLAGWLTMQMPQHYSQERRRGIHAIVVASFVMALFVPAVRLMATPPAQLRNENNLSLHLREVLTDRKGPLAGGADKGMLAAFYLGQSWHGEERAAPVARYREQATRVRWFLVPLERRAELAADPVFIDRTPLLGPKAPEWGFALLESRAWTPTGQ